MILLPNEIINYITNYLGMKDKVKLSLVCKVLNDFKPTDFEIWKYKMKNIINDINSIKYNITKQTNEYQNYFDIHLFVWQSRREFNDNIIKYEWIGSKYDNYLNVDIGRPFKIITDGNNWTADIHESAVIYTRNIKYSKNSFIYRVVNSHGILYTI